MPEIKHLEVAVMPNGEVLCLGKTVGWTDKLAKYLKDPQEYHQYREMLDTEREEIARLITEGNSSGLLDSEDDRCAWELKANIFKH